MLNPSTADASVDDPTIRRCTRFARDWGYSKLVVRNLFAVRATKPKDLLVLQNPTGGRPGNRSLALANKANVIVAAWGAFVPFDQVATARRILNPAKLVCLGTTKSGQPRHPLYVRADCAARQFEFAHE
jgi:hypothetical protein